ncbi:hypothetical protein ACFO4O_03840 [Glaciecola siphonariae]|uniref:LRAT domain-containing protein n=1 Tax=Glaciecola siphonariae TaxID=521012 RepID=A0ABV9LT14_9ALTE
MPAPLLWLGAAAISIYAGNKLNVAHLREQNIVSRLPGDCNSAIVPVNGSIVTCGIYEVLDHTGIWVDGNIYELNGSGLVRCVSPKRFIENRSGDDIYVACNMLDTPLSESASVERAKSQLYSLYKYHLLRQNCHKFVAEMIAGYPCEVTSFSDLNEFLSEYFSSPIDWRLTQINKS